MKILLQANTPALRRIGLRAVVKLPQEAAMLFTYDTLSTNPFWNKGVQYPIDIAFFGEDQELIYKTFMQANQQELVYCPKPYKWVLETNLNKIQIHNLNEIL